MATAQAIENGTLTVSPQHPQLLRSAGAVIAGLLAVGILSSAVDAALHAADVYPASGPMATGLYAVAIAYRSAFQIAGGYLTARLAPNQPVKHATVLGLVGLLLATLGAAVAWHAGPEFGPLWYPLSLVVLALPTVLAGARLRAGQLQPGAN